VILDPNILADLAVAITPKSYVRVTPMAHAGTPLGAGFGVTRFASPTKAFLEPHPMHRIYPALLPRTPIASWFPSEQDPPARDLAEPV
jgi:hypothetical protein